ncbi:hypothetical protein HUJ05_001650 [Dendroctonus ponderosae]|nr:hypothetical protein HUJ05_001650 [Dendroctonus ponderosae]
MNIQCINSDRFLGHTWNVHNGTHAPTLYSGIAPSEENAKAMDEVLMHLDHFLEENKYTAGSHLTIADFAIIPTIATIDKLKGLTPTKGKESGYRKIVDDNRCSGSKHRGTSIGYYRIRVFQRHSEHNN